MREYTVITEQHSQALRQRCTALLNQGWHPVGSVAVVGAPDPRDPPVWYCQAMIRDTPG